ncbi:MAG: HDIG domain-containing protein [Xanthomonadaceae bacterium]|nr:HDIG domain-containing protein [Xanthomonadaceae bacterium]
MNAPDAPADHATDGPVLDYPHMTCREGLLYRFGGLVPDTSVVRICIASHRRFINACSSLSNALRDVLLQDLHPHRMCLFHPSPDSPQVPILASADPATETNFRIFDHLPSEVCPIPGIVPGTAQLVSIIAAAPMRAFVESVFARRDVAEDYWTLPASASHHHARPGGLAQHSFEVAHFFAMNAALTEVERDIGLVAALFHDIGKVWAYTDDLRQNSAALALGHEQLGLKELEPQLQVLEEQWEDAALALRAILSGQIRARTNGSLPTSLLAQVRACDQRSCEHDRARNGTPRASQNLIWMPKRWKAEDELGDPY